MVKTLTDPTFVMAVLVGIAVFATLFTLFMPLLDRGDLRSRMKAVALERDEIRARERARLNTESNSRGSLRHESNTSVRQIVDRLNLRQALVDSATEKRLKMAGYRTQNALNIFLAARFILPIVFLVLAVVYIFVMGAALQDKPMMIRIAACIGVAYLGFYSPNIFISNRTSKRQLSIRQAWPDALDLMLICVESGISVEAAFQRVANEIASQSAPLAEELVLTTAELSYLDERRKAFENLGERTGLEAVKSVGQALIQAERYGTPIAQALRVLAQESRDLRMTEAEKKGAYTLN